MKRFDYEKFRDIFADFAGNYHKDIASNALVVQAWYEYLSRHLTEAELVPAFKQAIQQFEFLPSPSKLVEAIEQTNITALEEWTDFCKGVNRAYSPQAQKAFESMGGQKFLRDLEAVKLYGPLAKVFVDRWQEYRKAISSGKIAPPPPQLPPATTAQPMSGEPISPEDWNLFRQRLAQMWQPKSEAEDG